MNEQIKVKYQDVEITYLERENKWQFVLRGRERSATSLELAKEAIDKPEPKEKKEFNRVKVYFQEWGKWEEGEVTSTAEQEKYSYAQSVWLVIKGKRSKVRAEVCLPINDHNTPLVAQHREMEARKAKLIKEMEAVVKLMKPLVIEKEEA